VNFLLYAKLNKQPMLAIEVDGYNFHKVGTKQAERDQIKNAILENYEIPLMRFKTNESSEKERLILFLESLLKGE
jgi:very-short-patch-repair endonuclease